MTASAPIAKTQLGTAPYLPRSVAKKVSDIAMQEGLEEGHPLSVTVVDRDGVVINQQRADTATGATIRVSFGKAYAAAGFQVPTADLQNAAETQRGFSYISGFSIPGGLPIKAGGTIVGAIGVSGAPRVNWTPASPPQPSRKSPDTPGGGDVRDALHDGRTRWARGRVSLARRRRASNCASREGSLPCVSSDSTALGGVGLTKGVEYGTFRKKASREPGRV